MKTFKVGDRVRCNGYIGTVTRDLEWSDFGYEVRVPGGTVVEFEGCLTLATSDDIAAANVDPYFQPNQEDAS